MTPLSGVTASPRPNATAGAAADPAARRRRRDPGQPGRTALDTDAVARKVLAAVARDREEVVIERRGWLRLGLGGVKGRAAARALRSFVPRWRPFKGLGEGQDQGG